jgi:hypothetical protein
MFFFQVIGVLFEASFVVPPFQKVCANCHVANVIISPTSGVHYNTYCSKSTIQKLSFFHGSIATKDELVLLTIEGKWFEAIVHMTKFEFLNSFHPKQVKFPILIHIQSKFQLFTTTTFVGFKKTSNNLSHKQNLKGEGLIAPLATIPNDIVQRSVKQA